MAIRIPWDKYEVAILINAGVQVINKEIPRNKVVYQVSQALRERAIKNGIEIDDVFRNENGISMQLNIIVALLQEKKSGLHNASKLFHEMVDLYRSDYSAYNMIREEQNTSLLEPK